MERLDYREVAQGFALFISEYPRRCNKMMARFYWDELFRSDELTAELIKKILDAVRAQKNWESVRRGFAKNPDRWLRERNWEDEEPPVPSYGKPDRGRVVLNNHKPTEPPSAEEQAKIRELLAKRKTK